MIGFQPRKPLEDIAEAAEEEIHRIVEMIDQWATKISHGMGDKVEREVDVVCIRIPITQDPRLDYLSLAHILLFLYLGIIYIGNIA